MADREGSNAKASHADSTQPDLVSIYAKLFAFVKYKVIEFVIFPTKDRTRPQRHENKGEISPAGNHAGNPRAFNLSRS